MAQIDLEGNEIRSKVIEDEEPREPLTVLRAGDFAIKTTGTALYKKTKLKKGQSEGDKEEEMKLWVQKRMKLSSGSTAEPGDWDAASEALWAKLCEQIHD